MSIFLAVPGVWTPSSNGRDYLEHHLEYEEDVHDYFTSREDAQAWVDEQQTEGNAEYQRALEAYPARLEAFREDKRAHDLKQDEIAARAEAASVPYVRTRLSMGEPGKPRLEQYVKTTYEIWEIAPHVKED